MTRLFARLAAGDIAYGTFLGLRDPAVVEILGWTGYDFAVMDFEHTQPSWQETIGMIRAAELTELTLIARIGDGEHARALRLVEQGVRGVLVPHVTSSEDVRRAIDVVRYRPHGDRGIDPSTRAAKYGLTRMQDRLESTPEVLVFALVEDAEGIDRIEQIAATPGLDGVMLGPSDLARSYGAGADPSHPMVQEAVTSATKALAAAGVPVWRAAFEPIPDDAARAEGIGMVTSPPVDTLLIAEAFRAQLRRLRVEGG